MNTTRPPPPQGAPPSYAFATRIYQYNLRPVIITIAFLAALWALFGTIGNFRVSSIDSDEEMKKLATISIALGALYAAVCAFEIFGMIAACLQRLALIRIYAFLSALTSVIIVAAGLTRVVIHFTMKDDILKECEAISEGRHYAVYPYGFFGPVYHDELTPEEAERWCKRSYNHDSWADIVALLITIFLALVFTGLAFSYYRQMLDPSSVVNRARAPINNYNNYPSHYNPPYNASVPNLGYGYNMPYAGQPEYTSYAPPPGPPPAQRGYDADDTKPPGYTGADGTAGAGYSDRKDDDPFADFSDASRTNGPNGSRV